VLIAATEAPHQRSAATSPPRPANLQAVHTDVVHARRSIAGAAQRAEAIASTIAAMAEGQPATAVMAEIAARTRPLQSAVRSLRAQPDPTRDHCSQAARHLRELDLLLSLGIATCAASCARLADRLATLEEFELPERRASRRAAALSDRLVEVSA
jgi:hypothetical protein